MLGIIIGVAAVIGLMCIGKGTEATIISRIKGLGTNLLFIQPGVVTQYGVRAAPGTATTLTWQDAQAIAQQVPYVAGVAPIFGSGIQVVAGGQNMYARITGITPEYQYMLNLEVAQGSFISESHLNSAAKVAVLGSNVSQTLFANDDPIGQMMRLGKTLVYVIGVLRSKGTFIGGSIDDAILIPLTTMQQVVTQQRTATGETVVSTIIVQVSEQKYLRQTVDEIANLLRYRHRIIGKEDDFIITTQEDIIKTVSETTGAFTFLLGSIAAVSLLVGGIGVMNIMLVSVVERTREIGIRKALGAQQRDIIGQFLAEAVFLTLSGGVIGIMGGWALSLLLSRLGNVPTMISFDIVLLAFSVSVMIGLFFGFYPAWHASRLNPIEALRYE